MDPSSFNLNADVDAGESLAASWSITAVSGVEPAGVKLIAYSHNCSGKIILTHGHTNVDIPQMLTGGEPLKTPIVLLA